MRRLTILLFFIISPFIGISQNTIQHYFHADLEVNKEIPLPEEVIGFEVGDWHVNHDKLLLYFKELAKLSDKAKLENIGKTHEGRELINLIITS